MPPRCARLQACMLRVRSHQDAQPLVVGSHQTQPFRILELSRQVEEPLHMWLRHVPIALVIVLAFDDLRYMTSRWSVQVQKKEEDALLTHFLRRFQTVDVGIAAVTDCLAPLDRAVAATLRSWRPDRDMGLDLGFDVIGEMGPIPRRVSSKLFELFQGRWTDADDRWLLAWSHAF